MERLAAVCDQVAQTNSRLRKVKLLAAYLRELSDDDLARAVRFLSGNPTAESEEQLSVGYSRLREALVAVVPWDLDTIHLCFREVGDMGESVGLLLEGYTQNAPMPLAEAEALFQELQASAKAAKKIEVLTRVFGKYNARAVQYFVKTITRELRIGLQVRTLEEAVAAAAGVPHRGVREANNRAGNLPRVALAARRRELDKIEASLFHPLDFMLAKPMEQAPDITDPQNWTVEDKYDGIRSQIHTSHNRIAIFTRGLEDVTLSYPELTAAARFLPQSVILDGELLGWRGDRALSFTVLQQRLARKKLTPELLRDVPVVFIGYDILFHNGELLLDRPYEERRALLEQVLAGAPHSLQISPQKPLEHLDNIDAFFADARGRGNEGLILKRRGTLYESGRRTGSWIKVKRAYATLDVVITAAEQGNGKRATMLSDYTFAVQDGDRFVNVGKAYSGLTDEEIRELTKLLRSTMAGKYGRVLAVRPEIVLEVAFDGIQKSPRHKSGYALRFPRIVRWRRDKTAEDVDKLERVVQLYEASL